VKGEDAVKMAQQLAVKEGLLVSHKKHICLWLSSISVLTLLVTLSWKGK
jgi:hypothetical protein